jgi:hypothetical protein
VDIDLRIGPRAPAGVQLIDLQWTMLNDGGLTLNPAPRSGADRTDGSVIVQPRSVPQPAVRASSKGLLQALAAEQQRASRAPTSAAAANPAPIIEWGMAVKPVLATVAKSGSKAGWKEDFVGNLARSDDETNPNRKIKVTLPTTGKVAPAVSSLKPF